MENSHYYELGVKHVHVSPSSPFFAWYIVIIVLLVLLGGLFSGLTLGLMGLDFVLSTFTMLGGTDERLDQPPGLKPFRDPS